jgi:hypothetical protein
MTKPWHEKPLWQKVFLAGDRIYLHAGRIIGHLGCSPFAFYDAAKQPPDYVQYRYENAVRDLTVYALREGSNPRYELTAAAKKVLRIILGPAPDDSEYASRWQSRLISVKQMRDEGKEPESAAEPPVPIEPAVEPAKEEQPAAAPKPKQSGRRRRRDRDARPQHDAGAPLRARKNRLQPEQRAAVNILSPSRRATWPRPCAPRR